MARRVIEHRDFYGGDWGRKQPWNAPRNSFKALNMLVYSTGEIGVRPGLQNITPTNVVTADFANGIQGDPISSSFYYGQGTSLFRASAFEGQAQTTMTGAFTGSVSNLFYAKTGSPVVGNALYVMDVSRGIYSLVGNTLTQLTAEAGNGLALFGDRLAYGRFSSGPATSGLKYNGLTAGVSDLTSWPAANFIPVGDRNERPTDLWLQRGHLTFIKNTNGLFVFTGQLGVNETLRRAVNTLGPSPGSVATSCVTEGDMIWYIADTGHHIPASFDGTNVTYYEDQLLPIQGEGTNNTTSIAISDPLGVAITVGTTTLTTNPSFLTTKLHLFYHGVWSRHELPNLGTKSEITSCPGLSLFDPTLSLTDITPYDSHNVPVLVFGSNAASTPAFYSLPLDTDRPGIVPQNGVDFESFNNEMPGDASLSQVSGTLELPEIHLENSDEFMVRGVIVDFRSWDTGGLLTNHFDLQVDCLRPYDADSPNVSLTSEWDEDGTVSSPAGTVKRQVFMFGDQGVGNGYQLKFENIRGIAFQRFQVILETEKVRGI